MKKVKKLTPLSIRLEPDLKAALEELAKADERSLSYVISKALREYVAGKKPKK